MVNGAVMEAAMGERTAEPFMEEEEEQGHLDPFRGEAVGVSGPVPLQQTVAFELAQVVAELVETVGALGQWKVVRTAWWICFAVQPPR